MKAINTIARNLLNIPGKRIGKKAVVFESDDWGSIRMPSRAAYEELLQRGVPVNLNPFNRYDALESEEDLGELFRVTESIKDCNGNHPTITANFVMANPDFKKIKETNFEKYYYEIFTDTYLRYPSHKNSLSLVKYGIEKGLIYPQFHAREHINVLNWLNLLQQGHQELLDVYDLETFVVNADINLSMRDDIMASFAYINEEEKLFVIDSINDGFSIFEKVFGFESKSFIAPCYAWNSPIEQTFSKLGVKYIQGVLVQNKPSFGAKYSKKYRFSGQKNKFNQTYMVRNCYFEPSTNSNYDWVSNCLNKVQVAFNWGKPAIISVHRLNFIGSIFPENRDKNLKLFKELLSKLVAKWPDIEFLNSEQMGKILNE